MGASWGTVTGREFSGPQFVCFISSRDKPCHRFHTILSFVTSSRIKRHCAKELPRSFLLPPSDAFQGQEHLRARRCTL